MNQLIHKSATEAWLLILNRLDRYGTKVYIGRTKTETLEILNNSVAFDMNYPIINHSERKLNYQFLAAEAYAICHGDNRVENIAQYNKNIEQFSDDGYIFNGAYGPPFNEQLYYVVNNLLMDDTSRQAVLTIWKQNPVLSKDVRCTLSLQFIIRNGFINTMVNMRSSDVMWGICYDFSVFTFMTLRVLTMLNSQRSSQKKDPIELGAMYWNGGSSHIYDKHYSLMDKCLNGEANEQTRVPISALIDWKFITDSLHSCMKYDMNSLLANKLWKIDPKMIQNSL